MRRYCIPALRNISKHIIGSFKKPRRCGIRCAKLANIAIWFLLLLIRLQKAKNKKHCIRNAQSCSNRTVSQAYRSRRSLKRMRNTTICIQPSRKRLPLVSGIRGTSSSIRTENPFIIKSQTISLVLRAKPTVQASSSSMITVCILNFVDVAFRLSCAKAIPLGINGKRSSGR